jgi:hypothetical protein
VVDAIMFLRAAAAIVDAGDSDEEEMHPRQSLAVPLVVLGEFDEAEASLAQDDWASVPN